MLKFMCLFLLVAHMTQSKHVTVLTVLFAVFSTDYVNIRYTADRTLLRSLPTPNKFYDLNLSEQRVEIFMMFQSHEVSLIHSEFSARKYIDLGLVKYLNVVNETEWNFITSPTCVHVFVRC